MKDGVAEHPDEVLLRYSRKSRNPFAVPKELQEDLQSSKYGLSGIVLHGTYNPPMVGLARFLRKIRMPYIFIPHDPYPPSLRNHHRWRKSAFWRIFEKRMIESAVAVQLLDSGHEKFLRELGCRVETFVEANGCEVESLELIEGEEYSPGTRERVQINYLGRMDCNHKGLDLLIEGFSKLEQGALDLVLTGNDWFDRQQLEDLAESLGVAGRVKFRGRRPEPSIVIQSEADLCVLPSRFDGFGMTIVEAMLAARPVLVSSAAGIAPHVKKSEGGWIVEPNADAIGAGLKEALDRKVEWSAMGRKNRDYVLGNLTWEQVARRTLEHYRRLFQIS
jgi:glycosyltransferase involved in cell wall biosynthesis